MHNNIIIQLVIILTILFILINYFIAAGRDLEIINDVINYKSEDEDDEAIYELEEIRNLYLRSRFKYILIRGGIFGICALISINYLTTVNSTHSVQSVPSFNYVVENIDTPIVRPNNYFNDAPW
jgi:hypothetical protein